jgi:predicted acylesterase/phospholipase RssA
VEGSEPLERIDDAVDGCAGGGIYATRKLQIYEDRIMAVLRELIRRALARIAEVAFYSMETMQNTIARLKLASYAPDIMIEISGNACGYREFWRAKELIALGYERAARAFEKASM